MKGFHRLFFGELILMTRESQGGFLLFLAQRLVWPALAFFVQYFGYSPFTLASLKALTGDLPIAPFSLAGIWTLSFFMEYVGTGFRLSMRRDWALLELIYASPFSRMGWLLAAVAAATLGAYLVHLPFLILACIFIGMPLAAIPPIVAVTSFIALASISWGMFICAVFLVGRNSRLFYAIFETPAEFFSGSRFPLQALPAGAALLGVLYPLAQSTTLFRLVLSGAVPFPRILLAAASMLLTTLIYCGVAFVTATFAERSALKKGNLSYS